jgi:uncharacterized protein YfaS (alpha-2-macroglobulin family)
MCIKNLLIYFLASFVMLSSHALEIVGLSPQGEVSQVRQVVVNFDEPTSAFGTSKGSAPVNIRCSKDPLVKGDGRWIDDKSWVFDFEDDLPPGVKCIIVVKPGLKSVQGQDYSGVEQFRFQTGGPFVQAVQPYEASRIDEEQFFAVRLSGDASLQSVQSNVWCMSEGVGERIGVKMLTGQDRLNLLKSYDWDKDAEKTPLAFHTLSCLRRFTPSAKVQLVFGKGVATPNGVASTIEKRFSYQVRDPFEANFSCERENAQSACLPLRPLTLNFSAPVPKKYLEGIRLVAEKEVFKPVFDDDRGASQSADEAMTSVRFAKILPELSSFQIELPKVFKDESGRTLRNAANFPLKVATAALPPLVKFSAAPFGVVERLAETNGIGLLPVTLRNVEAGLNIKGLQPGLVSDLKASSDAQIIEWFQKVERYHNSTVERRSVATDTKQAAPKVLDKDEPNEVQTRMISLLQGQTGVKKFELPMPTSAGKDRPFEMVGIPLEPGFHVLEVASQKLGAALLDERYGGNRTMYVRTSALVTNLAVHFKLGREGALAWVTSLDKGKPVPNASVKVSDCRGKELASAKTDASGVAKLEGLSPKAPVCNSGGSYSQAYFVSARAQQPMANGKGSVEDLAFTWSDWNRGIEAWRFNLPSNHASTQDEQAHTILDRNLLRAGDSVSMKHLIRSLKGQGFGLSASPPTQLVITHIGSGQAYKQPLLWRKTATGGQSAESTFSIPKSAKLGAYEISLHKADGHSFYSGQFRVEEFRLPIFEGRVNPSVQGPLISPKSIPVNVQINYVAGGPAANLPVRVSAQLRPKYINFADHEGFSFDPPTEQERASATNDPEAQSSESLMIADKVPVRLDKNGAGQTTLAGLVAARTPQELLLEATYSDPNGEVQTLRSTRTLWPSAVMTGIKTENWLSSGKLIKFQALAVDLNGKPQAGVPLEVRAKARIVTSTRKRMVGGFYTYDNTNSVKDMGRVCSGDSDGRGLLLCETSLSESGEVELVVTAKDTSGNSIQAASSVYVTKQGELWFGGENHDRIDLLPEKKSYEPGETARFQVRMPFRSATALVTIEREGIFDTKVVQLRGQDPTIEIKVNDAWGPNVYVSVLALRGRLRDVPWYSFFTWGYQAPREWWTSFWYEGQEYTAPTALVDLSKPAFRLGVAEIRVGTRAHQLDVTVKADKENYSVRSKAQVQIQVKLPNGQPAANAEVALVAVDQALLELMPNESWNLLEAMMQRRAWGVETSTAHMEIIGRRHFGRKAVPAGGGGGRSGTRELLDTLLLWNPKIQLDATGQATVAVPLNDALSAFKIVAVADASTGFFGSGSTQIRTVQDLQIISGLPPLVREEDLYRAQFTLRNTTKQPMKVVVSPRATLLDLKPQQLDIPAGESREVAWTVTAPAQLAYLRAEAILWEIEAKDTISGASDRVKAQQRIVPAIPLTVQQATLVQLGSSLSMETIPPAHAIPSRGGLKMVLQPRLSDGLPGVQEWFVNYPYSCLEQKVSKSLGLKDAKSWKTVINELANYTDADGLLTYFPIREGEGNHGSDVLTAYVLAASHEESSLHHSFELSEEQRAPLERGLLSFVQGRVQRDTWSPRKDLDIRKLAAIEALSRYGKAQGTMLNSITVSPNQWPTHAVIDWVNILRRVEDVPDRDKRLAQAHQVLRSRISFQGTKLIFNSESDDYWWWLMQNGDANSARLLLAVLDDPAWESDKARLASGLMGRLKNGAWLTTTANFWGGLALEKFSAKYETAAVSGRTSASLGAKSASVDWTKAERNKSMFLPWGNPSTAESLKLSHQGSGKPWLTLQSLAAVRLKDPVNAGYQIEKTMTAIEQANTQLPSGSYTRGDVIRVTLKIKSNTDMSWVAVTDPVPAGATILGGGLGRDSEILTQGEKKEGVGWPVFEERSFESFIAYYDYLPKGVTKLEYTLRLNNVGEFSLPASRVEAMYAPEMYGAIPNPRMKVEAAK